MAESISRALAQRVREPPVLAAVVVLAVILFAQSVARSNAARLDERLMDLRAFWCAGKVVAANADPYVTEPLRTCEHGIPESMLRRWPNAVIPFTHPGYDVVVFEGLSRLPFPFAAAVFMTLAFAALGGSIVLLTRTFALPWSLIFGALAPPIGLSTFLYGQVAAFELFFIAVCAAALAAGRGRLAGAVAPLTLVEPHIGLFVVLATAIVVPKARIAIVVGTGVLVAIGLIATGPAAQMTWLTGLGGQAMAEARYEGQYSLTYVLTAVGVPTGAALASGTLSTLVLLIAAVVVAHALAQRGAPAAIVLIPAAFAVVGGTFIHITQIALAIPAALLLYRDADTGRRRTLAAFAVVLLSVPWSYAAFAKPMLGIGLITPAVLVWHLFGRSIARTLAAVAACWYVFAALENNPPRAEAAPVVHRAAGTAPASASWAELLSGFHGYDAERILVKVPTWFGLSFVVLSAALAARRQRSEGLQPETTKGR